MRPAVVVAGYDPTYPRITGSAWVWRRRSFTLSSSLRVETVASLAERLGLTQDAIVREVVQGRLPYVNVGGHWRFREKDIDYWVKRYGGESSTPLRLIKDERSA